LAGRQAHWLASATASRGAVIPRRRQSRSRSAHDSVDSRYPSASATSSLRPSARTPVIPLWCSWRITRDLPDGRAQVGDRHLKIYEPRDNLMADISRENYAGPRPATWPSCSQPGEAGSALRDPFMTLTPQLAQAAAPLRQHPAEAEPPTSFSVDVQAWVVAVAHGVPLISKAAG
jgi:hypothetical protein